MKLFTLTLAVLMLAAQGKVDTKPEQLTTTETIAVNQVVQELVRANRDAANVLADIQKAHPGYTFNYQKGVLEKLPVKATEGDANPNVVVK